MKFSGFNTTEKVGIGVGTSVPEKDLTVQSATSPAIGLYSTYADTNSRNWAINTNNSAYGDFTISTSAARLGNPTTIKMSILKDGKVGIGTTTQSHHLQMDVASGNVNFFAIRQADYILWSMGLKASDTKLYFRSGNPGSETDHVTFQIDGKVGIGTTSPAALLDVRGTVKVGVNDAGHDVMLYGATSGRYWEWDQSMDLVRMRDNVKTVFGNGDDLQMYFDGTDGYIKNHVGGALRIRTKGDFTVQTNASDGGAEDAIKAINNGAVELYYDGAKKLETTSAGVTFTGTGTFSTAVAVGDAYIYTNYIRSSNLRVTDNGYLGSQSVPSVIQIQGDGDVAIGYPTTINSSLKATTILDASNSAGTNGQVLTSTGSALDWKTLSEISGVDGSGTANYIPKWTDSDTIGNSSIHEAGAGSLQIEGPSAGRFLTLNAPTTGGYITFETADTAFADIGTAKAISGNAAYSTTDLMINTRSGTKNIVFGMNGVEKVRIDNNGKVGIGTTNPGGKLEVDGSSVTVPLLVKAGTGANSIKFVGRSTDNISSLDFFQNNGSSGGGFFQSNGTWMRVRADGGVHFRNGNTPVTTSSDFTINGMSLGIGTTAPAALLQVGASGTGGGGVKIYGATNGNPLVMYEDTNNAITHNFHLDVSDNAGLIMYAASAVPKVSIQTSGNSYFIGGKVGIGTTAPSSKLTVESNSTGESISDGLRIHNSHGETNDISPIYFGVHGGTRRAKCGIGWKRTGSYGIGKLLFALDNNGDDADVSFANDTKITFQGDGNVGIGTTAPGAPLEVVGGSTNNNDTANVLALTGSEHIRAIIDTSSTAGHQASLVLESNSNEVSIATTGSNEMRFNAGGSERVRINSNGKVGIGTTSPSAKLDVFSPAGTGVALAVKGGNNLVDNILLNLLNQSGTTVLNVRNNGALYGTAATFSGRIVGNDFEMLDSSGTGRTLVVRHSGNQVQFGDGSTFSIFRFNGTQVIPHADSTATLGTSALRWSTVYGDNVNLSTLPSTTVNAAVPILFRPTEGTLSGDTALTWNPAADSLDVNGTVITSNHIRSSGTNSLKLGSANGGIIMYLTATGDVGIGTTTPNSTTNKKTLEINATWGGVIENSVSGTVKSRWDWSTGGITQFGTYVNEPLHLMTNSAMAVTILANGNVGIGDSTPSHLLHIRKDQNAKTSLLIDNRNGGTGASASIFLGSNHTTEQMDIRAFGSAFTTSGADRAGGGLVRNSQSGGLSIVASNAAGETRFYTAGSADGNERMRITSGGKVGIGCTNPQNAFNVQVGTDHRIGFWGTSTYSAIQSVNDANTVLKKFRFDASEYQFMGGKVGIGTDAPDSLGLNIARASTDPTASYTGNSQLVIGLVGSTTHKLAISRDTNGDNAYIHSYQDGVGAKNLILQPGGGIVGIGTTAPGARLELSQADASAGLQMLRIRNFATSATGAFTGDYVAEIRSAYTSAATKGALLVHTQEANNSRPTMSVSDSNGIFATFVNGNVGIGTVNAPNLLTLKGDSKYLAMYASDGSEAVRLGVDSSGDGQLRLMDGGGNTRIFFYGESGANSYINNGGNLGIGTTTPGSELDIEGSHTAVNEGAPYGTGSTHINLKNTSDTDGNLTGVLFEGAVGTAYMGGMYMEMENHSSFHSKLHFATRNAGSFGSKMVLAKDGKVGIGTANPTQQLMVWQGSSSVSFGEFSNGAVIWLDGVNGDLSGGDYFNIWADGNSALRFGYGTAQKVSMLSSGRFGIGVDTPSNLLSVEGSVSGDYLAEFKQGHSTAGQSYGVNITAGTNASDQAFRVANQAQSTLMEVRGDGEIRVAGQTLVDNANTNYKMTFPDNSGIAMGSAYTFANIYGNAGNIYLRANAYPASTGSTSKIYLQTANGSGGQASDVVVNNGKLGIGNDNPFFPLPYTGRLDLTEKLKITHYCLTQPLQPQEQAEV